jgi:hypothetical protein
VAEMPRLFHFTSSSCDALKRRMSAVNTKLNPWPFIVVLTIEVQRCYLATPRTQRQ